jgi:hypothetical protein
LDRRTVIVLLAFAAIGPLSVRAAGVLQWERLSVDVTTRAHQRVVHVDFPFRNSGDQPLTIVSVETSCRCTSAETSKRTFASGEKGTMGVDVALDGQEGVVEKSVTVTTDGAESKPLALAIRIANPRAPAAN